MSEPRTEAELAEYVRHHRCFNADRNVTVADWDRGILAIEAEAAAPSLTVERVLAAIPEDWSPFWHETPIEEADGVHSMMAEFDRPAFATAILAALTAPEGVKKP